MGLIAEAGCHSCLRQSVAFLRNQSRCTLESPAQHDTVRRLLERGVEGSREVRIRQAGLMGES
jgi:hypothetical protein